MPLNSYEVGTSRVLCPTAWNTSITLKVGLMRGNKSVQAWLLSAFQLSEQFNVDILRWCFDTSGHLTCARVFP